MTRFAIASCLLGGCLSTATAAETQSFSDLRLLFGSTPGATELSVDDPSVDIGLDDEGGLALIIQHVHGRPLGDQLLFVWGLQTGWRAHEGSLNGTSVEYDAFIVGLPIGLGLSLGPTVHLELKGFLDVGLGDVAIDGVAAVDTDTGFYVAYGLTAGGYWTLAQPGFQIGLEAGWMGWSGRASSDDNGTVVMDGDGFSAALSLGYRF